MSDHPLPASIQPWNHPSPDITANNTLTSANTVDSDLSLTFHHGDQQTTNMDDFQLVDDRMEAYDISSASESISMLSNLNAGEQNLGVGCYFDDFLDPQPSVFRPRSLLNTKGISAYPNKWMGPSYTHSTSEMLADSGENSIVRVETVAQSFNEFTQDGAHTVGPTTSPKNVSFSDNDKQHDLSARFMGMIAEANIDPYEFIASMFADRHLDEDRLREVVQSSRYRFRRDGTDRRPANRRRDPVSRLHRKCFECGGMETKQWRRHPESKVYLCNPCGQKAYRARFSENS